MSLLSCTFIRSIIVFDELFFYPGRAGDTGEARALLEFLSESGRQARWVGIQTACTCGIDLLRRADDDDAFKTNRLLGPDNNIVPWTIPTAERVAIQIWS